MVRIKSGYETQPFRIPLYILKYAQDTSQPKVEFPTKK